MKSGWSLLPLPKSLLISPSVGLVATPHFPQIPPAAHHERSVFFLLAPPDSSTILSVVAYLRQRGVNRGGFRSCGESTVAVTFTCQVVWPQLGLQPVLLALTRAVAARSNGTKILFEINLSFSTRFVDLFNSLYVVTDVYINAGRYKSLFQIYRHP